jgi:hypothetical protein
MMADRLGCSYLMLNPGLHLITDRKITKATRVILSNNKLRKLYSYYAQFKRRGKSKTLEDHLKMKEQLRGSKIE